MPRVRSDDYEAKSQAIMDCAAALFAKEGYPTAKMQDVAKACGATKSMLYHYFPTKDDLLFAMLQEHLQRVIQGVDEAIGAGGTPRERLQLLVEAYTQKSTQSRRRHVVAMNDVKFLPKAMQAPLIELQRQLTDRVAQLLRELNPALPDEVYKPYTMMLVGMLNWADFWYRPSGAVKPQELCDRMSRLFLKGFLAEKG
ncbi:TetR/AcrR family transcriptional regulator [Ramlibacter tataouinensis]|uniref:TetR/AcrR family transcriptional regulator n=1 Tax=Ramlibacter tataouinensis TaxID=94132 RepID=UPI0022F3F807|nr:TetR/AcrR family transcriptional regulator [Ramlibacter tataouinensis]WBY03040.1 TetR/AcrR family transcriptional regulator [Ramlibacter tataouinensis]